MEILKEMGKDCGSQSPGSGSQSDRNIHTIPSVSPGDLGPHHFAHMTNRQNCPGFG